MAAGRQASKQCKCNSKGMSLEAIPASLSWKSDIICCCCCFIVVYNYRQRQIKGNVVKIPFKYCHTNLQQLDECLLSLLVSSSSPYVVCYFIPYHDEPFFPAVNERDETINGPTKPKTIKLY